MRGYTAAVSAVAEQIRAANPTLSNKLAHQLAAELQTFPVKAKHRTGDGKAWYHEHIRESYGRDGTRILTNSGLFSCTHWDYKNHLQRRWTLTEHGESVAAAFTCPGQSKTATTATRATDKPVRRGRPRTRSVQRYDKRGNRAANLKSISTNPTFNVELAQAALNARDDLTETTRAQLQAAIDGDISHEYRETSTGRLQGQGVHFQHFTKQAKAICFPDCWDIDITNCQPSIIGQLAAQYGIDTPAIRDYTSNTKHWRRSIAEQTGIHIDDVKGGLIALCFGASVSGSKCTTIVKKIGEDQAKRFHDNGKVRAFYQDIKRATTAIVKAARAGANRQGNIRNASGKSIHKSEPPKRIMAHVIQGMESYLMKSIVEEIGCEVQLWIHDGILITEKLKAEEQVRMQNEVKKKTGISISISAEELNPGWQLKKHAPLKDQKGTKRGGKKREGEEANGVTDVYASKSLFSIEIQSINFGITQSLEIIDNTPLAKDSEQYPATVTKPPDKLSSPPPEISPPPGVNP